MATSIHSAVVHQISHIVARHLGEVSRYIPLPVPADPQIPPSVLMSLNKLDALCAYPSELSPSGSYTEVSQALDTVTEFLRRMNQPLDEAFWSTPIAEIVLRASRWCERAGCRRATLPRNAIWKILAPAQPDHLKDLGDGLYEARWWTPVPMMDVEILQRTAGIQVIGEPFEPPELPCGLALRFSVQAVNDSLSDSL
jgi:hypothetical protein